MSSRINFFSQFSNFPYFTKDMLRESAKRFSIKKSTFNSYIYKSLKEGNILSLKRNYYVSRNFYENHKTDTNYILSLAGIMLKPSYISLETALQHYGLFAEAVDYTITSVTLKLPREFKNRMGRYVYRHISETLFNGFRIVEGNPSYLMALPHKAIFDYLYYQTNRFSKNVHPDILEEFRIDTDILPEEEKRNLNNLISKFTDVKINL